MVQGGVEGLFYDMEEGVLFSSEDGLSEAESQISSDDYEALTIEDFNLGNMAFLGMRIGGSGLIVSLLVLGIMSLLRMR